MNKKVWPITTLALLLTLAACGSSTGTTTTAPPVATQAPTSVPTATPTQKPAKWATVQTFSGNGSKKTGFFSVPDNYKILWSCKESNIDGYISEGNLDVTVYGTGNSYIDNLYETCKVGSKATTGETEEHQGGQVYLDIVGSSDWSIQVQVLK